MCVTIFCCRRSIYGSFFPDTAWKHRFVSRCLNHVHEQAFGARIPSYKTIQELDKKVRNFHVPPSLRVPGFGGAKMMEVVQPSIQLTMQRHIVFAIKEISESYSSGRCRASFE